MSHPDRGAAIVFPVDEEALTLLLVDPFPCNHTAGINTMKTLIAASLQTGEGLPGPVSAGCREHQISVAESNGAFVLTVEPLAVTEIGEQPSLL